MRSKVVLYFILIIYLIIGIKHSSSQGFWHDEIYSLTFLKGISAYNFDGNTLMLVESAFPISFCKDALQKDMFLENFNIQILHEGHPPLYFLLLKLWSLLFGYSELALRSFSLIAGIFSILIFFNVCLRKFNKPSTKWMVISLLLINPFLFYYFTEARMYAFAFLLAVLCFKYWLEYKNHRNLKSYDFLLFCIFSISLLYTHYYGVFFLMALMFYDVIKNGWSLKVLSYSIPVFFFLPWIPVILIQTDYHTIHWTNGSFSFLNSIKSFMEGLISLFYSPMSTSRIHETVFILLVGVLFLFFSKIKWNIKAIFFVLVSFYFAQLFCFDKLLDHHTIAVPRYYMFILIFFFWGIARVLDEYNLKPMTYSIPILHIVLSGIVFYQILTFSIARKQMFRELAAYIDSNHDERNTLIVAEPNGVLIWGVANYINGNFQIVSAEHFGGKSDSLECIFIDEMIGDVYWENHLNNAAQSKMKLVPFAGVFLYE